MGDAEDRDEPVGAGDGDLGDEGFDKCLGLVVGAAGDDLGDVVGHRRQGGGFGGGGLVVEREGEFVAADAELLGLGAEFGESVGDEFFVRRAALERGQVSVDGLPGLGDLVLDGGEFGVPVGVRRAVLLAFVGDGVGDEVVPCVVEGGQGVQDGRVYGVGVEALEVALAGVVAGEVPAAGDGQKRSSGMVLRSMP